ncbi:MAG: cell division protein FtsL [Deltaproteobacteria bacterium]|nr:cell division protein FtsL [Deltaproteobacteria bacterium]
MKGRFFGLWLSAIVASGLAFVAHLALRIEAIRLGYAVDRARRERDALIEQIRLLEVEKATLQAPERIEAIARLRLKMAPPGLERTIAWGAPKPRQAAGRLR